MVIGQPGIPELAALSGLIRSKGSHSYKDLHCSNTQDFQGSHG